MKKLLKVQTDCDEKLTLQICKTKIISNKGEEQGPPELVLQIEDIVGPEYKNLAVILTYEQIDKFIYQLQAMKGRLMEDYISYLKKN